MKKEKDNFKQVENEGASQSTLEKGYSDALVPEEDANYWFGMPPMMGEKIKVGFLGRDRWER